MAVGHLFPFWVSAPLALAVGIGTGHVATRWRYWRALWTTRHARRQPLVWNDDGIHAPVLLPGESLQVEVMDCADGHRHVVAHVMRPNGSIRKTGEWTRDRRTS